MMELKIDAVARCLNDTRNNSYTLEHQNINLDGRFSVARTTDALRAVDFCISFKKPSLIRLYDRAVE